MMPETLVRTEGYFMSTEQEMAARGQMMTEYRENEAKLATLYEEARKIGKGLEDVGRTLQGHFLTRLSVGASLITHEAFAAGGPLPDPVLRSSFDIEAIERLLADVHRLIARQEQLRPRLVTIGFLER